MFPPPILLLAFATMLLVVGLLYVSGRAVRQSRVEWHELTAKLRPIHSRGVAAIADAYLHPRKNQIEQEPEQIYAMLGGAEGLHAMYENTKVMLELAGYATRWNAVEAAVVTEMIRRDARRLQKAVHGIQLEMLCRRAVVRAPFRMQEAAAAYHLMSSRLLALYETSHIGLYPRLVEAL